MTKYHPGVRMLGLGLVLLALVTSLVVTTHMVSVSHAATHVPVTEYAQPPLSFVGKLFIKFTSYTKTCTGTVVYTSNENTVNTAAHCFYDDAGNLAEADQIEFCPQYHDAYAPLGCWIGKELFVSPHFAWVPPQHETHLFAIYDYGFLVVSPQNGQTLMNALRGGIRPIPSTSAERRQITAYGYPSSSALYSVTGQVTSIPLEGGTILALSNDDLASGASGGPWILTVRGTGYLIGQESSGDARTTSAYSPVIDNTWLSLLYEAGR